MKSSVQDEKFSKIKSKCCALKKNIFAKKIKSSFEKSYDKQNITFGVLTDLCKAFL